MNEPDAMLHIMHVMDEVNGKELLWSSRQIGKLYANLEIIYSNGVTLDERSCRAFAKGTHTETTRNIRTLLPLHYRHVDEVLDDVYEQKRSDNTGDAEPDPATVPANGRQGDQAAVEHTGPSSGDSAGESGN